MSEDYSSVDRLGADVGPEYSQQGWAVSLERLGYVSVSDAEKREHICPLAEYVRRSTGEIVVNISRVYLSRAERFRSRDKVTSVRLTPKNKHSYPI